MDNFLKYRKENVSLLLIADINEIFVKSSFKKIFHIFLYSEKKYSKSKRWNGSKIEDRKQYFSYFGKYLVYYRKKKLIFNILFKRINILKKRLERVKK